MIAADRDDAIQRSQQRGAVAKRIQRTDFDQTFQRTLAHRAQIDTARKVIEVFEYTVLLAFSQDQFNRALTHILYRPKPKADIGNGLVTIFGWVLTINIFNRKIPTERH